MKLELLPLYNINLYIGEFFNVDLNERGFYQFRVRAKKPSNVSIIDVIDESENSPRFEETNEILSSAVFDNIGVTKTVEVTYVSERLVIDDTFTIGVKLNPTSELSEIINLSIEIEMWFMDRYRPPSYEMFDKIDKRTIEVILDPSRLIASARPLYFDSSNHGCITIRVFSSLVAMESRRRRNEIVETNSMAQSPKLRSLFSAAAHSLLFTTKSLQSFIIRFSALTPTVVNVECVDIQQEKQKALQDFESSQTPLTRIEIDVAEWSHRVTVIFQQLLAIFQKSDEFHSQLMLNFDKQRLKVLSEAFWFNEKSKECIGNAYDVIDSETMQTIIRSKYLRKFPRVPLFCPETDQAGDKCAVIFEECYSAMVVTPDNEGKNTLEEVNLIALKAPSKVTKSGSSSSSRSLRDLFRTDGSKSLRLIGNRNKSVDFSQSVTNGDEKKGIRLVSVESKEESPVEPSTSESIISCSQTSSERCSAAGEVKRERMGSNEVREAMKPSNRDVEGYQCSDIRHSFSIPEEHPADMMTTFEFLREREDIKKILKTAHNYEGFLYSEKANLSIHFPPSAPLCSKYVEKVKRIEESRTLRIFDEASHLIVFVHGLDGNHDDLSPYRLWMKHALESFYLCKELDEGSEKSNRWQIEYLMSRANLTETWTDLDTMAHNLLNEIREFVEKYRGCVRRISFVGHSLGGVIIRAAIGIAPNIGMDWIIDILHTLLTINTPHLGIGYTSKHILWGAQVIKWWKKSQSMEQLAMRDSVKFSESYMYNLAGNEALGKFRNILLIGSPDDVFVPYTTSLLEPSRISSRDPSAFGEAYRQMLSNLLASIRDSSKTKNFVRYTVAHQVEMSNANRIMGRAAHIAAMEDLLFIEKLITVSAVKYFV